MRKRIYDKAVDEVSETNRRMTRHQYKEVSKKCNNMSKRSLWAINQSIQKDNVNISDDKVKIKQVTQNLINLSERTIRAFNRSTQKGEEVFTNILMSDDDDTDNANVLVLDSLIDDELTQKTLSHVSETHNDDCTNIHEKLQKRKASVQAMKKINNITRTEENILQTNSDITDISINITFIEPIIHSMYGNMSNNGTDDQATIFDDNPSKV